MAQLAQPEPVTPFMARALALASAMKGCTSPNPAVGAVLVQGARVVGEGATQPGGRPHAETVALAAAGEAARGADLYVTLEPCSHHGKTPPCAAAVAAAGVARVVIATLDPNPLVAGRGRAMLEAAGIPTEVGDGRVPARTLNEDFGTWITTNRPHVLAKLAMSLDGRMATASGESQWITGPEARAEGHRLRGRIDAILAGVNTVLADDPQLTARIDSSETVGPPPHQPRRLVLDSYLRTPATARLFSQDSAAGPVTVFCAEGAPGARRAALEAAGARVVALPAIEGRVDLRALLDFLGAERVTSVLVEGGATVHGAFFDADLVDQVVAFIAPRVIGGTGSPGAVGGHGVQRLVQARPLQDVTVRQVGADTLIAGYTRRVAWPD